MCDAIWLYVQYCEPFYMTKMLYSTCVKLWGVVSSGQHKIRVSVYVFFPGKCGLWCVGLDKMAAI